MKMHCCSWWGRMVQFVIRIYDFQVQVGVGLSRLVRLLVLLLLLVALLLIVAVAIVTLLELHGDPCG